MSVLASALYVVATPIGNLQDISLRALEVLRDADLILAEDTRHSARLLRHYGITTPVHAFHGHNEHQASTSMLKRLRAGEALALITDAGTPLISDPGLPLVSAALAGNCRVIPIPGPCALIAALCSSGLGTAKFVFEGFLPPRSSARLQRLRALAQEERTQVFYEAPHRLLGFIEDLTATHGGQRMAALAKEITKIHETVCQAPLEDLYRWLREDEQRLKGEFVLVVEGREAATPQQVDTERTLEILLKHVPLREAVTVASELLQVPRNQLYRRALAIKNHAKKP